VDEKDVSKKEEGYMQEMEVKEVDEPIVYSKDIPSFTITDEDDKFLCQSTGEVEEELSPPLENHWQSEENAVAEVQPPVPPKRMRRSRKEPIADTLCNGNYTKEDWLENFEADVIPIEEVSSFT
jgi:hypothetical protein